MNQIYSVNSRKFMTLGCITLLLLLITDYAMATTAGGGLPFDTWLVKIQKSITGPFAFTAAIVGMVASGATLIFGGEMNGFMRTMIFIVLVLSFLVAAQNTMTAITGKGAEISRNTSEVKVESLA